MTYDTVNMADCSNAFYKSMVTTVVLLFVSRRIKNQYYQRVDNNILLNRLHCAMIMVVKLVQILCVEPINYFNAQPLYLLSYVIKIAC